ncbi:MAG: lipoyl synthase [Acidobacteria bacterium]|nr:MAG: lipoyl synthase [Acidobacteriota bacterium]PYS15886.1 MAG: lipoyl synthase [Acidobacteriota bacterium]
MSNRPDWLKVRIPSGENFFEVRRILRSHQLNTICEDALCPNIAECWGKHRTATFMILGNICTRACAFCAVTSGRPTEYDLMEPARVAAAIAELRLKHAVITSVDRDDLVDGGAAIFAETVREIRRLDGNVKIELLTPDFQGSLDSVKTIANAGPDVFSHNIETVRRLYPRIRFKSDYTTSFGLLKAAKGMSMHTFIKTGIMVGLGETTEEIVELMGHAVETGVDILTIGQYLRPSMKHAEIEKYYHPAEFAELGQIGRNLGIRWVFSGPLVRSSYHAEDIFEQMMSRSSK